MDCIDEDRILDWDTYLLPAGESKFLDGAIKSRLLAPYDASAASLAQTIEGRPQLLAGQSVVFVNGKNKVALDRKAYVFLIRAMGATRIAQVPDLASATKILSNSEAAWDWIYLGDDEAASTAYPALLEEFGTGASSDRRRPSSSRGRGRKQSRSGTSRRRTNSTVGATSFSVQSKDIPPIVVNGKRLHVLVSECLCQSLILGKAVLKSPCVVRSWQ
ncbi:hypothetical protein KEM55_005588 [Ascosphaera atra]|nr:hypothetical protein KEM55_005588 [Ascosphaera atra]